MTVKIERISAMKAGSTSCAGSGGNRRKLAHMLLDHLEGMLNYCRMKVPMGVIEAVNGNVKALL